jgi:hypothetical protein
MRDLIEEDHRLAVTGGAGAAASTSLLTHTLACVHWRVSLPHRCPHAHLH